MTKEELMNAITGLPAKTQVYKIDDYSSLKKLLPSTVAGAIVLLTGGSYILYVTFKRKNFLTILKK